MTSLNPKLTAAITTIAIAAPAAGAQAATHKLDPPRHYTTHWSQLHLGHFNQTVRSQFSGTTAKFQRDSRGI